MVRCVVLAFAVVVLVVAQHVQARVLVEKLSFSELESGGKQRLVVFYRSSQTGHEKILQTARKAAKRLRKDSTTAHVQVSACDCDEKRNLKSCDEAKFNVGAYWFTVTEFAGIEKMQSEGTLDNVVFHVQSKYWEENPGTLVPFTNEHDFWDHMDLADSPKPIFVMFAAEWCAICQRVKPTFKRAAGFFRSQVDFMIVDCSTEDDDIKSFCARNQAQSFPRFVLFTSDEKHPYTKEDRSALMWDAFFKDKLGGEYYARGEERPAEEEEEDQQGLEEQEDDDDASSSQHAARESDADQEEQEQEGDGEKQADDTDDDEEEQEEEEEEEEEAAEDDDEQEEEEEEEEWDLTPVIAPLVKRIEALERQVKRLKKKLKN